MLFFRVLGPLVVESEGSPLALGGPLQRRLMAGLLAAERRPVSDSGLIDLVWGSDASSEASKSLRVMVSRARAVLGAAGPGLLRRSSSGYVLDVPADRTDHGRFTQLCGQGARLLAEERVDEAIQAYQSALALWRGAPWEELADTTGVSASAGRLRELREVALEELAAARLVRGDPGEAVAELSEAAMAAPYRERRWELLALALYRAGRQAQALAELRRASRLLAKELGADPGPALREMERRILEQDPALLRVEPEAARAPVRHEPAVRAPVRDEPAVRAVSRPLSSFVGRESELAHLAELAVAQRLVTIVGPPGVGKTRLAVEYTADQQGETEVWFARLADAQAGDDLAASAASVTELVAGAVGVQQRIADQAAAIGRALADRPGVLVLDNCEHVLDAAADVALTLLNVCPHLRIVATSRRALRVAGEQVITLEPLPVTDAENKPSDAVRLLLERVHARRPGWVPSEAEIAAAHQVCLLLDGLPLAIELAAGREKAFGLVGLAAHLRDGLDVLGTTPAGSVTPHASLSAAIGWSVEQLDPDDRALLSRLWPFEGGFTWQAAEAVVPSGTGRALLAGLASLVERSMIQAEIDTGPARYRMLETVRHYCRELDPDPANTRAAHARWVRTMVAEQTAMLEGPLGAPALRALRTELPNIRAGVRHDLEHRPADALSTVSRMDVAWVLLGNVSEGVGLIDAALEACPDAGPCERAAGLLALSFASSHGGDAREAVRLADAALALLGEPSDPEAAALYIRALHFRGAAILDLGDAASARDAVNRLSLAFERLGGPDWVPALTSLGEGMVRVMEGRYPEAVTTLRETRDLARRCGSMWVEGLASWVIALGLLGQANGDRSSAADALALLNQALDVFERQGNRSNVLAVLRHGCYALALLGRSDTAASLHGAVHAHAVRTGTNPSHYAHLAGPAAEAGIARLLADPDAAEAQRAGAALSWTEMIQLFVDATPSVAP